MKTIFKASLFVVALNSLALADTSEPPKYSINDECKTYNPDNIQDNPDVRKWNAAACIGTEYAFRDFVLSQWHRYSAARHAYCTEWNAKTPTNFGYMSLMSCLLAGQATAREEEWGGPD